MSGKTPIFLAAMGAGLAQAQGAMKASFTQYGGCSASSVACGQNYDSMYSAAVNEAWYGAAPGEGAGPGCGKCYKLTVTQTGWDEQAVPNAGHSIVVAVDNLCPRKSCSHRLGRVDGTHPLTRLGVQVMATRSIAA